jgi:hypothetical protein
MLAWADHVLAVELWRAAAIALSIDRRRGSQPPRKLISSLRARGALCGARSPAQREVLRRAIRVVDRCFVSGPNCFRRVLMEIALDAGAASEPLHMGLNAEGGVNSGHVWFPSAPEGVKTYDAEFVA